MIETLRDPKDPQAKLDYYVDWTTWLGEDTIQSSTWTVPNGLVKVSEHLTGGVATVFVRGGIAGQQYTLTNAIVTVGGRADDRSFILRVAQR